MVGSTIGGRTAALYALKSMFRYFLLLLSAGALAAQHRVSW
jgi:hypothetical protein